jgi:hypothetical protein
VNIKTPLIALGIILSLAASAAAREAAPVLSRADEAFLKDQARRIVDSARLAKGGSSGKWRNTTPYDLHVPGGNMGYPAYWVRDSIMMLGGDFISKSELEGWIRLIVSTLRGPKEWTVRPGVIVPAYAVPDHINFDGLPIFYPGNYETGDKQGGPPWGKYPPLDDHFYFINAVYEHWKMTGSLNLFQAKMKTTFSEERLADLCEKIYRVAPEDPATGIAVAGDVETENAKDWGFSDAESKSGKLLFPSVLKFQAAGRLAMLFDAAGEPAKAKAYRDRAAWLKAAIPKVFFHAAPSGAEGWLHSATGVGNQPDIWGSAFAVFCGALDAPTARKVALALTRAFRDKTGVRAGCVRQIPTTDTLNQGGWQISIAKTGTYQNGGYWGTPSGWTIAAIATVDPAAAAEMAGDFVRYWRSHMRPDGMTEAWEWSNPDTGESNNPLYVATIALSYLSLKEAGLLNKNGGRP